MNKKHLYNPLTQNLYIDNLNSKKVEGIIQQYGLKTNYYLSNEDKIKKENIKKMNDKLEKF